MKNSKFSFGKGFDKMDMYYLLIEAKPSKDNDEQKEFGGAFVNCWVKTQDQNVATNKANNYILSERWEIINIEEVFLTSRAQYNDEQDLQFMECKGNILRITCYEFLFWGKEIELYLDCNSLEWV